VDDNVLIDTPLGEASLVLPKEPQEASHRIIPLQKVPVPTIQQVPGMTRFFKSDTNQRPQIRVSFMVLDPSRPATPLDMTKVAQFTALSYTECEYCFSLEVEQFQALRVIPIKGLNTQDVKAKPAVRIEIVMDPPPPTAEDPSSFGEARKANPQFRANILKTGHSADDCSEWKPKKADGHLAKCTWSSSHGDLGIVKRKSIISKLDPADREPDGEDVCFFDEAKAKRYSEWRLKGSELDFLRARIVVTAYVKGAGFEEQKVCSFVSRVATIVGACDTRRSGLLQQAILLLNLMPLSGTGKSNAAPIAQVVLHARLQERLPGKPVVMPKRDETMFVEAGDVPKEHLPKKFQVFPLAQESGPPVDKPVRIAVTALSLVSPENAPPSAESYYLYAVAAFMPEFRVANFAVSLRVEQGGIEVGRCKSVGRPDANSNHLMFEPFTVKTNQQAPSRSTYQVILQKSKLLPLGFTNPFGAVDIIGCQDCELYDGLLNKVHLWGGYAHADYPDEAEKMVLKMVQPPSTWKATVAVKISKKPEKMKDFRKAALPTTLMQVRLRMFRGVCLHKDLHGKNITVSLNVPGAHQQDPKTYHWKTAKDLVSFKGFVDHSGFLHFEANVETVKKGEPVYMVEAISPPIRLISKAVAGTRLHIKVEGEPTPTLFAALDNKVPDAHVKVMMENWSTEDMRKSIDWVEVLWDQSMVALPKAAMSETKTAGFLLCALRAEFCPVDDNPEVVTIDDGPVVASGSVFSCLTEREVPETPKVAETPPVTNRRRRARKWTSPDTPEGQMPATISPAVDGITKTMYLWADVLHGSNLAMLQDDGLAQVSWVIDVGGVRVRPRPSLSKHRSRFPAFHDRFFVPVQFPMVHGGLLARPPVMIYLEEDGRVVATTHAKDIQVCAPDPSGDPSKQWSDILTQADCKRYFFDGRAPVDVRKPLLGRQATEPHITIAFGYLEFGDLPRLERPFPSSGTYFGIWDEFWKDAANELSETEKAKLKGDGSNPVVFDSKGGNALVDFGFSSEFCEKLRKHGLKVGKLPDSDKAGGQAFKVTLDVLGVRNIVNSAGGGFSEKPDILAKWEDWWLEVHGHGWKEEIILRLESEGFPNPNCESRLDPQSKDVSIKKQEFQKQFGDLFRVQDHVAVEEKPANAEDDEQQAEVSTIATTLYLDRFLGFRIELPFLLAPTLPYLDPALKKDSEKFERVVSRDNVDAALEPVVDLRESQLKQALLPDVSFRLMSTVTTYGSLSVSLLDYALKTHESLTKRASGDESWKKQYRDVMPLNAGDREIHTVSIDIFAAVRGLVQFHHDCRIARVTRDWDLFDLFPQSQNVFGAESAVEADQDDDDDSTMGLAVGLEPFKSPTFLCVLPGSLTSRDEAHEKPLPLEQRFGHLVKKNGDLSKKKLKKLRKQPLDEVLDLYKETFPMDYQGVKSENKKGGDAKGLARKDPARQRMISRQHTDDVTQDIHYFVRPIGHIIDYADNPESTFLARLLIKFDQEKKEFSKSMMESTAQFDVSVQQKKSIQRKFDMVVTIQASKTLKGKIKWAPPRHTNEWTAAGEPLFVVEDIGADEQVVIRIPNLDLRHPMESCFYVRKTCVSRWAESLQDGEANAKKDVQKDREEFRTVGRDKKRLQASRERLSNARFLKDGINRPILVQKGGFILRLRRQGGGFAYDKPQIDTRDWFQQQDVEHPFNLYAHLHDKERVVGLLKGNVTVEPVDKAQAANMMENDTKRHLGGQPKTLGVPMTNLWLKEKVKVHLYVLTVIGLSPAIGASWRLPDPELEVAIVGGAVRKGRQVENTLSPAFYEHFSIETELPGDSRMRICVRDRGVIGELGLGGLLSVADGMGITKSSTVMGRVEIDLESRFLALTQKKQPRQDFYERLTSEPISEKDLGKSQSLLVGKAGADADDEGQEESEEEEGEWEEEEAVEEEGEGEEGDEEENQGEPQVEADGQHKMAPPSDPRDMVAPGVGMAPMPPGPGIDDALDSDTMMPKPKPKPKPRPKRKAAAKPRPKAKKRAAPKPAASAAEPGKPSVSVPVPKAPPRPPGKRRLPPLAIFPLETCPLQSEEDTEPQETARHGSIRFWIDLVPASKESMYEVVNMAELRAQQEFEIRFTFYRVEDISIFNDFGDRNDVLVKGKLTLDNLDGTQQVFDVQTDVHKYARSTAAFYFRVLVKASLPVRKSSLKLVLTDEDFLSSNDPIYDPEELNLDFPLRMASWAARAGEPPIGPQRYEIAFNKKQEEERHVFCFGCCKCPCGCCGCINCCFRWRGCCCTRRRGSCKDGCRQGCHKPVVIRDENGDEVSDSDEDDDGTKLPPKLVNNYPARLYMDVDVLPQMVADGRPVGPGRDAPNPLPYPRGIGERQDVNTMWLANPCGAGRVVLGTRNCHICTVMSVLLTFVAVGMVLLVGASSITQLV